MTNGNRKKIIVSVTNDLVTDQRVHKVCATLHATGYDVLLVGRELKDSAPVKRAYETFRIRLIFKKSFFFYAEYNIRLFFYLLFSRAELLLSNDTDTLLPNYLVSRLRHIPLIFDAHELFTEMPEVIHRRFVKSFWGGIENLIFPQLKYCYTVCQSIADIYNQQYAIQMQVVRNIPPARVDENKQSSIRIEADGRKVLLYQGAVNIGRGIEWIIDAMPLLDGYVFYIAGDGDVMQEMRERVKKQQVEDRVVFLGRIPFEDLSSYTACADIGVSLLENNGLNYYYSLPNRIFDFIRKKVPILATDFPEIRKIIAAYEVGKLVVNHEPEYLASVIRAMVAEEKNEAGFAKANAELTWENESEILLKVVSQAAIHV